jgi:hypothetical protein
MKTYKILLIVSLLIISFIGCRRIIIKIAPPDISEIKLPVKMKRMPEPQRMIIKKYILISKWKIS